MASVLTQLMEQYCDLPKRAHADADDVSTRGKRRKIVQDMTLRLEKVRDAEDAYLSNIPDNLQGSSRYDAAQESVDAMDEVIELLGNIY
jgi:hypothetical protein